MATDRLGKQIRVGDVVYYWAKWDFSVQIYKSKVVQIYPKTLKLKTDGLHQHINVLKIDSRNILSRTRQVGDTVVFKKGTHTWFGDIIRISPHDYATVNNIRDNYKNDLFDTTTLELQFNSFIKVFDGKKSKIQVLRELC
jgi:hypothetical protein